MKFLKNKKVVLASGIILGIAAITSSALAAYIVTGGKKDGSQTIDPSTIEIQNKITTLEVGAVSGTLLFEPDNPVSSGRVLTSTGDGNLTVTIPLTVTVSEKSYIPEMTVTVTESAGTAVTDGYVTVPTIDNLTSDDFSGTKSPFTCNLGVNFGWGIEFDYGDPVTYYNTGNGSNIDASQVVKDMEAFATAVNATTFTVTIDAAASVGA